MAVPSYRSLIERSDEETLQKLIGRGELRLLRHLDPTLTTPESMKRIVLAQFDPIAVVRDQSLRELLLVQLREAEAKELAQRIGKSADRPFSSLLGLRIRKNSSLESAMFGALSIAPHPQDGKEEHPNVEVVEPGYPLFDHQRRAVREVTAILASPRPRVLLHMPTGSGKTRTAMNVISEFMRSGKRRTVIWLAYSEELCEQAAEEFGKAWSHLGSGPTPLIRFYGNRDLNIADLSDGGIVVAGLDKMFSRSSQDATFLLDLGMVASITVIDEAHQAIAPTYRHVLEMLVERRDSNSLLGLTATPGRTWNSPEEDAKLADFFYRQKVTLGVPGYENPVEYLIDQEYLAQPIFEPLYHRGDDLSGRELESVAESLDIPTKILERLAADELRNLAIIQRVEHLTRTHRRVLVFAATVDHAGLIAAVLEARGVYARTVTGRTGTAARAAILADFKSSDAAPRVIVNYGVLTTGFDAPETDACVIARPTNSLVLYSQMVGRAIRGKRAGGNEKATVVTVVDTNLPGFGDLGEAFKNWEDVW